VRRGWLWSKGGGMRGGGGGGIQKYRFRAGGAG